MGKTYRAVEITKPGIFHLVERSVAAPGAGQVRIRVEACGVCHSDAATVDAQFPGITYPRVPGHEVIGHIEEVGPDVTTWKVGQRVGVGFFGGEDGTCEACRRGESAYCQNPIMTGITSDGGYAEMMIAEARALALIPDELKSEDAARRPGYVWRSFVLQRIEARDGGVYVELETVALSRGIPLEVRWLIKPLTDQLPRRLLLDTLNETRVAVGQENPSSRSQGLSNLKPKWIRMTAVKAGIVGLPATADLWNSK